MSMLWDSLPLVSINNGLPSGAVVATRLNEPLGSDGRPEPAQNGKLLSMCLQLDTLLTKKYKTGSQADENTITVLTQYILRVHKSFSSNPVDYMGTSELIATFPQVASLYSPTHEVPTNTVLEDYLLQMGVLNQLVVISKQLLHDIDFLDNHKYIAHQIALLYQSVGKVGGPLIHIKKNIESRFEEIKATTEQQGKTPKLNESQQSWLKSLLEDVLQEVFDLPIFLTGNIQPLLKFAK